MTDKTCLVCIVAFAAACSNKSERPSKLPPPPAFEVTVHEVEHKAEVVRNKEYEDQGLGAKAVDGKTFVCTRFSITNTGGRGDIKPPLRLVDGKGQLVEKHAQATLNYKPDGWQVNLDVTLSPGEQREDTACFEVASDATTGMKVQVETQGWGRHPTRKHEVALH